MSSAASTVPSIPNNLPLQLTSFVGRERQIAEVKRLLRVSRLLTLTGAGGSGKTRLALQIAAAMLDERGEYKHGVHFVSLASIRDPGLLISVIAQTLDVRESPGQPLEASLKAYVHDKHLLLLLDNFEQIVAAAPQVVDLLKAAPDLKLLVTSRASLQVSGEQQYPLQPLALPDLGKLPELEALSEVESVKLFVQRATNVKPQFTLAKENSQVIAEICHRLDGLPLAIELAAARMNVLTPRVMLEKLSSSLMLLTSGARDRPARHQTLRSAIEWSYSLLDTAEQKLFRRMAVFVGGCTLEATEAVCNAKGNLEIEVLDGVASLVDKSLLRQQEGVRGEPGFWMLETIHEYAREKLQESGEAEALHKEHAIYFMRLAEAAEPHLPGKQQQAWLERLEVEHDNFRAALRWAVASAEAGSAGTAATSNEAQTAHAPTARERATTGDAAALTLEIGLRTAGALRQFWDVRGYYREGGEQLQRLLSAADRLGCSRAVRVKALNAAGVLTYRQGEYAAARSTLEQALAMGSELGDRQSRALSLHHLGNAAFGQGDYAAARSLFQESLALRKDLGDTWGIAICLNNLGSVAFLLGDDAVARSLYEDSLVLFKDEGDKWGITVLLINLGSVAYLQGEYAAARSSCAEGLVTSKEIGSKFGIAVSMAVLGGIAAATGQPQRGARLLGAADVLLQEIGCVLEAENRRPYQAAVASARAQLGEAEFEKARQHGRSLLMEQAIAYAIEPTLLPTDEPFAPAQAPASSPAPESGARSGTRTRYPEGLTRREVEVLRLVAEGLTNAEIAHRLFLSPNTVNVHLYSIFSKLGVTTRTAAARFAVEHKLA